MEQIVVKHPNGSTTLLVSKGTASGITSAEQDIKLLGEDTVKIVVKSAKPITFYIGDTIEVYNKIYTLNQLPAVKKEGARKLEYTLTLEGLQYELIDVQWHLPDNTALDSFTGDIEDFLDILISCANAIYPGKWVKGQFPANTEFKTLNYFGNNCLEVLQALCKEYEQEFEISQTGGVRTINIKTAGVVFPYTFRYGRTGGLYELRRENVDSKNVVTRLYVYGGTTNVSSKYRYNKLCLPGKNKNASYIEDAAAIALYGVKENTITKEKIFPNRYGVVSSLGAKFYSFFDNTMDFDLNEKDSAGNTKWLNDGVAAKVKFTTGNLAGYEFEVHKYDNSTKEIQVVPFQDENGMKFPSETSAAFQFAVGDKYLFTDINLPDSYYTQAETKLAEAGNIELNAVKAPNVKYSLGIDQHFIAQFAGKLTIVNLFGVGDYIPVIDDDLGINKSVRITEMVRDLLKPYKYTLTLGDTVTTTTLTRLVEDVDKIDDVININNLADPSKARRNWMAAQEVLANVFDPDGNYYSEKIKPLSVETTMLSVGARSQQFVLQNTRFEPNYQGAPNVVLVVGGSLIHYTIEDNIRIWDLTGENTIMGLDPAKPYYIYARCSRTATNGSFTIETVQHKVDADTNYYYFLIGTLSSVLTDSDGTSHPARLISLTYGATTINGRFINTGRIMSSGGGTTYFDIDAGEIGGNIKFVSSDGTTKSVSDLDDRAQETKDYIDNTLPGIISNIQSQLDGQIEQWFYTVDPSLTGEPNSEWNTTALKENHLGDLYYNTATGKVWRYIKTTSNGFTTYSWSQLSDEETAQALQTANDALALARTKRRIFTETPYTPYEIGDLWVQGTTGDIMKCKTSRASGSFTSSDWEKASKYTDDSALNTFVNGSYATTITNINSQIDGKIESWFQTTDPAANWTTDAERAKHVGDMWYSSTAKLLKRYSSSYTWTTIEDQKAIDAYTAASQAQDTADGKRRVFVAQPYPPYDVGDLWLTGDSTNGKLKRCITSRATGSFIANDWVIAVYYDNTQTTIDGGIVTSGTVQLAGDDASIKAGITGEGTEDTSVRIWAGASKENKTTAPFRVLQNGKAIMSNAEVSGTVNANSGTIGGFEIASGRIGAAASSQATSGEGLSLYNDFIKFADSYRWAMIGTNVLPASTGAVGVGRFENTTPNSYMTNYGIFVTVTGGLTNIAFSAVGDIVCKGDITAYTFATITPTTNNCYIPGDLTSGGIFKILARFINSNSGIGFPERTTIAKKLAISTSTPFMVRFTMIAAADSTQEGYIIGRNTIVTNSSGAYSMNTSYYPYRLDNDGNQQTGKMYMQRGDIVEFMLVYNGSTYYAYELQHRD